MANELEGESRELVPYVPRSEISTQAAAAAVKAEIEASFMVARANKRNRQEARVAVNQAVSTKEFAEAAVYKKPVGKGRDGKQTYIEGGSIRLAEECGRAWGNIRLANKVIHDDPDKRIIAVGGLDLETNIAYLEEITIVKLIERKYLKEGQEKLGDRLNSKGEIVYQVRPTDDEIDIKCKALVSKAQRNIIFKLIPADIQLEAIKKAQETLRKDVKDNIVTHRKKIVDAFAEIGVMPKDLEGHLKHGIDTVSAVEIEGLRKIYQAIVDKEASWNDYVSRSQEGPETGDITDALTLGEPEQTTPKGDKKKSTKKTKPESKEAAAPVQAELPDTGEAEPVEKARYEVIEGIGVIGDEKWEVVRKEQDLPKMINVLTEAQCKAALARINELAVTK